MIDLKKKIPPFNESSRQAAILDKNNKNKNNNNNKRTKLSVRKSRKKGGEEGKATGRI